MHLCVRHNPNQLVHGPCSAVPTQITNTTQQALPHTTIRVTTTNDTSHVRSALEHECEPERGCHAMLLGGMRLMIAREVDDDDSDDGLLQPAGVGGGRGLDGTSSRSSRTMIWKMGEQRQLEGSTRTKRQKMRGNDGAALDERSGSLWPKPAFGAANAYHRRY